MMVEQRAPAAERVEVRCAGCASWLATVPAGTIWARARCIRRGCTFYGLGQTVQLGKVNVLE
jgi:hypothetical protein